MTTKMTNRKILALKTKENVYNSALKLIREQGYENTSIRSITTMAGVSTGTFYAYFPSKEHILIYTYDENERFFHEAYDYAKAFSFPDSLLLFVEHSYDAIEERGAEILRAISNHMLRKEFKTKIRDKNRAIYTCLSALLESAKLARKISSDTDIPSCVEKIFLTLTGAELYWCINDFDRKLSSIAKENTAALVNGLFTQPTIPVSRSDPK